MHEDFIYFNFSGGMADNHQLNFYEAARFQYGAARLIYILEEYRQTGRVLEKVSHKIDTDIRVSAAQKGSWELEIALAGAMAIGTCTIRVPLGVLFSYLLNKLKPKEKGKDLAILLAQQNSEQLKEHTKQIEAIKDIVKNNNDTIKSSMLLTDRCLELLERISPNNIYNLNNPAVTQDNLLFGIEELKAEKRFYKKIAPYYDELIKIPDAKEEQLSTKFRMVAKELALPLKSSANSLSIGLGTNRGIILFDENSLSGLGKEIKDKVPTSIMGNIKSYDKETGWGKFRPLQQSKPISFCVIGSNKTKERRKILKTMDSEIAIVSFYPIRNLNGQIIRLIFDKIVQSKVEE